MTLDETHDSSLKSWVSVDTDSPFPIQNLPFSVFQQKEGGAVHVCTAIGNYVLDLAVLEENGLFRDLLEVESGLFSQRYLNPLMAKGKTFRIALRKCLSKLLSVENGSKDKCKEALISMDEVNLLLPVDIGDYTDFYSSREHATNVGTMFRGKDNALMPNWLHLPVAYHGRSSSVIVGGEAVRRPSGQSLPKDATEPIFAPCRLFDFELEMGCYIATGNNLGVPVDVSTAEEHIFGLALVNDWSARDIQKWEYQPLGPFLAKNFATSIAPWVVTMEALEPFRCQGPKQDPKPFPYLQSEGPCTFDIKLEVYLQAEGMEEAQRVCHSNFKDLYWDMRQQIAHHTVTGCNMRTGDLLASGTISGSEKENRGSMLELSWAGKEPLDLSNGETRTFLKDGDVVTMRGWAENASYRIGFGDLTGKVLPALQAQPAESM
jgi:fumarylacetoacetase